ncbi:MAG: L-2-hydroxyglutarate oxidase [Armatimonadetes bacterium]|nr:L-2-hydroxyglutarate oxidase [Armatimonadota bacterium]
MTLPRYDFAVIGGGIVGLATALALTENPGLSIVLLEAEDRLAAHQTGHNSGVIHSGLYYKPGSLKARNCVEGREALVRFCRDQGISHDLCGKVVVAVHETELPSLEELERRGNANGLTGLRKLGPEEIREYEPHVTGIAGLLVPQTGIVDYAEVAEAYARLVRQRGGTVQTCKRVFRVHHRTDEVILETHEGEVSCRLLINCGGLQSDRIAHMCGTNPGVKIIPFRGEYYELVSESRSLVRNLIYPVPDPRFPFLGVHFTRMIHGGVEAGPNAVLAFNREGYSQWSFSPRDALETFGYCGFWKMASKYWRTGMGEFHRSFSKEAFVRALQRLIPELGPQDVKRAGAGVRAQAVAPDGGLVDDFRILEAERAIHVLNAPSPAATASISIGRTIAALAVKKEG